MITFLGKKCLQKLFRARCQYTAYDRDPMIVPGLGDEVGARLDHSGLRFRRPINQSCQTRMYDRAAAHHAGLQGHIERTVVEAIVAKTLGRVTQRLNFGMGAGVAAGDRRIMAAAYDLAPRIHQHRPHGYFTRF